MGLILGRFRKKKTTLDVLESIDREIKSIEEFRRNTEQTHKRIVGRFVVISVGFYLVTAFLFYFYYFPANFYDQLFYIIPLVLAPVIILIVKRVLTWYYHRKIAKKQDKLTKLRSEKKDMLEKVMETETYKVAKIILDKFAPIEQNNRKTPVTGTPMQLISQVPNNTGLRQRAISPNQQQLVPMATPVRPIPITRASTIVKPIHENVPRGLPAQPVSTHLPMPRAVLPRERSLFDKMVDYLVGDGPSNRYALICKNCYSHNGMAFRDEVEYFSFRCCYCYTFNPALKKRPVAPKFEYSLKSPEQKSDSEFEKNSLSDTDSESDDGVVVLKSAQEVARGHEDDTEKPEPAPMENNEKEVDKIQEVTEIATQESNDEVKD